MPCATGGTFNFNPAISIDHLHMVFAVFYNGSATSRPESYLPFAVREDRQAGRCEYDNDASGSTPPSPCPSVSSSKFCGPPPGPAPTLCNQGPFGCVNSSGKSPDLAFDLVCSLHGFPRIILGLLGETVSFCSNAPLVLPGRWLGKATVYLTIFQLSQKPRFWP